MAVQLKSALGKCTAVVTAPSVTGAVRRFFTAEPTASTSTAPNQPVPATQADQSRSGSPLRRFPLLSSCGAQAGGAQSWGKLTLG